MSDAPRPTAVPYQSIEAAVQVEIPRILRSRFVADAIPVTDEAAIFSALQQCRERSPDASHVCYAWCLPPDGQVWRANDDGEPRGSAGMPILKRIQGLGLMGVLIAVTRWYGGTNLGDRRIGPCLWRSCTRSACGRNHCRGRAASRIARVVFLPLGRCDEVAAVVDRPPPDVHRIHRRRAVVVRSRRGGRGALRRFDSRTPLLVRPPCTSSVRSPDREPRPRVARRRRTRRQPIAAVRAKPTQIGLWCRAATCR